ncbi:hypothetical protein Gorai_021244 [Gossypium raimondii]|uniref:Uncharacterized protein n=1 Tax=Gossypium raimondii TaxID=29730 RepID=A0A7J8NPQ5_GOSRA|nr:hypothetical protein [Gossypium raimondii]
MLYMFVNQISMLGSVLDDDWPVEAEKQAMQEDEVPFFPSVTTDDDSLDFLDGGSTD